MNGKFKRDGLVHDFIEPGFGQGWFYTSCFTARVMLSRHFTQTNEEVTCKKCLAIAKAKGSKTCDS